MRKFLIIPILSLSILTGCASIFGIPTTTVANPIVTQANKDRFNAVQNTYGITLAIFDGYRDACAARRISNFCRSIVIVIQPYIVKVQGTIVATRKYLKNPANTELNIVNSIQAVETAVADFKSVMDRYGVK